MDTVEVPQYFVCPISLQIMKDPVTISTGITFDRESIEAWLFTGKNKTCPVTKQPLHKDLHITPNHTLRRLIQAWCIANASNGVDLIPTPKSPVQKTQVIKLLQELWVPSSQSNSLKKLAALASEGERNRRCMEETGVAKTLVSFIITCFKKNQLEGLEEALSVFQLGSIPSEELKLLVMENYGLIDSLTWVLRHGNRDTKIGAILILKSIAEVVASNVLERLQLEFFQGVTRIIKDRISREATKAALHILLEACPWGRNRMKIVEAGAVFELIELELATASERRSTEITLCVLDHLCACADGRARFLGHPAGIALVTKRILRVSPTADDGAVRILSSICKFSATQEVLKEMLRVGAVSKLSMVIQANCAIKVKEKARGVLRLHSKVWNSSPCIAVYLLTRYP